MRLLEHQGKALLAAAGIPIPDGAAADSEAEAAAIAARLGGAVMVKAQVRSGGRGKAGGILAAADTATAGLAARQLLGSEIGGLVVQRVLVERQLEVERELYLGLVVDYDVGRPVVLLSARGGVDIEQAAEARPAGLARIAVDPLVGLPDYVGRDLARRAGLEADLLPRLWPVARALYELLLQRDALLAEINPLVLTRGGDLVAADARITIDDAALPRQPELARFADELPDELPEEAIKRRYDFDLLVLDPDGDIGLLSTGAGGTMMTLDLIQQAGGRPYNFADVRTGRLLGDPTRLIVVLRALAAAASVRAILISVFGAVTDLADFARTLSKALDAEPTKVPVVVRVQGHRAAEAQATLRARGLTCFDELEAAVAAVVAAAR